MIYSKIDYALYHKNKQNTLYVEYRDYEIEKWFHICSCSNQIHTFGALVDIGNINTSKIVKLYITLIIYKYLIYIHTKCQIMYIFTCENFIRISLDKIKEFYFEVISEDLEFKKQLFSTFAKYIEIVESYY